MSARTDLKRLLKQTGKPKRQLYMEMKISAGTFYNILNGKTTPTSQLFFEKLNEMKIKYKII